MAHELRLREVHVFKPVPKRPGQSYLAETHPVQVLKHDDQTLFIQDGFVFAGEKQRPLKDKELPAWFHEAVRKLPSDLLASLKYTPPTAPKA